MNYPKPEIQQFTQPAIAQYLYVPEYKFKIKFKQPKTKFAEFNAYSIHIDDDSPLEFSFPSDGADGFTISPASTGTTMRRQIVAEPFELVIENNTNQSQPIHLFDAYKNRTATNYGNPVGVFVGGIGPRTYAEYMAQTEHKPCFIEKIQIEVLKKPKNYPYVNITSIAMQHKIMRADGFSRHNSIQFKADPFAQRLDMVEKNTRGMELNRFAGYTFTLTKQTSIRIKLYREA